MRPEGTGGRCRATPSREACTRPCSHGPEGRGLADTLDVTSGLPSCDGAFLPGKPRSVWAWGHRLPLQTRVRLWAPDCSTDASCHSALLTRTVPRVFSEASRQWVDLLAVTEGAPGTTWMPSGGSSPPGGADQTWGSAPGVLLLSRDTRSQGLSDPCTRLRPRPLMLPPVTHHACLPGHSCQSRPPSRTLFVSLSGGHCLAVQPCPLLYVTSLTLSPHSLTLASGRDSQLLTPFELSSGGSTV